MGKKKRKLRVAFQKNRRKKPGRQRDFRDQEFTDSALPYQERISGKGELSRHRTIIGVEEDNDQGLVIDVDVEKCLSGRVLSVHRSKYVVQAEDGAMFDCVVRDVVRRIATEQRTVVVAGDRVLFLPSDGQQGVIERVEPRTGTLSRETRGQQHVLVANVEQVLIVASAADPPLKPNLIDRYLISSALGEITPVICINKIDLVDPASLQPVIGLYGQLGYDVILTSVTSGDGLARLGDLLKDRQTVVAGQSGVGKSSLLNAVQPGLELRTAQVSVDTRKGRHTTTAAELLQLSFGGWVVDTPGIRQFGLWDTLPEEVEGFFIEFSPFVRHCRFPDCSHTHETTCGIKEALGRGYISPARYESYLKIASGDAV